LTIKNHRSLVRHLWAGIFSITPCQSFPPVASSFCEMSYLQVLNPVSCADQALKSTYRKCLTTSGAFPPLLIFPILISLAGIRIQNCFNMSWHRQV
jgi:hypothetical protein